MNKIVYSIPVHHSLITFDDVFQKIKSEGFVISVYQNKVSILNETYNRSINKNSVGFFSFCEPIPNNIHTRTEGTNITEALENLKKRISCGDGKSEEVEYFYFKNLQEFARAVIEFGWI